MKFVLEKEKKKKKNTVGKWENASYQHFLLFSKWFQKLFFSRCVKSRERVRKS